MNKPIHFVTSAFKDWRNSRDWTQQEMAGFLTLQFGEQVLQERIADWEAQRRGLTAERALELSKALKIDPSDLFTQKVAK